MRDKSTEPGKPDELSPSGAPPTEKAGGRVLLVDDDPLGRKLSARVLSDAGFSVDVVSTAEEALNSARAAPPDAILSDIRMPGMDGFEFCQAIRRDHSLAGIPVVLASSTSQDELDQPLARKVGARALVPRTSHLLEVIDALRDALRQK